MPDAADSPGRGASAIRILPRTAAVAFAARRQTQHRLSLGCMRALNSRWLSLHTLKHILRSTRRHVPLRFGGEAATLQIGRMRDERHEIQEWGADQAQRLNDTNSKLDGARARLHEVRRAERCVRICRWPARL